MKTAMEIIVLVALLLLLQGAVPLFVPKVKAEQNGVLTYPGNWCLNFTGTNASYVSLGYAGNSANLTIEAWVKPAYDIAPGSNSTYGHRWGTIAHHDTVGGDGSGSGGWWFGFDYLNGVLDFQLYHNYYTWVTSFHTAKPFWNSSSWYYIAVTYDEAAANSNLKFYANGDLDSQQDGTYSIYYYSPALPLEIGAQSALTSTNDHFVYVGLIDEFRVWNVSQTTADIQNSWNRTLSNAEVANPNLVGYWRFDDGSGIYAQDSSLYGYVGTLMNGPQWTTPGAQIVPEFSSILVMLALVATISMSAILLERRSRKLNRASFREQPKLQ